MFHTTMCNKILPKLNFSRYSRNLCQSVLHYSHDKCPPPKERQEPHDIKDMWYHLRSTRQCTTHKVTVVGAGSVGMSCLNSIILRKICRHVVLIDKNAEKLSGEALEYSHASTLLDGCKVESSTDMKASRHSKVIILCVGNRPQGDESRLNLTKTNAEIFKEIVPQLFELSRGAIFIIVTNPVDILSWLTWKLTGLPIYKVLGSGTVLDSARFAYLLSRELNCHVNDIQAPILGEHGNSQVPIWSQVTCMSTLLRDKYPNCGLCPEDCFYRIAEEVKIAGPLVRSLKGDSNIAVGLCVADMVQSLLLNTYKIRPVSTLAQGHYGINKEVFLSLPCDVDEGGIYRIFKMPLNAHEIRQMQESANILHDYQKQIKL